MGSFARVCLLALCCALVHVVALSSDCSDPVSIDWFGRCPHRFSRCGESGDTRTPSFPVSGTCPFFFILLVSMFCVERFSAPPDCPAHVEWLSPSGVTCF